MTKFSIKLFLYYHINAEAGVDQVESLSEGVPDHEYQAEPDDDPQDDGVAPLAEVDLVHQVIDQRKLIGQVIELGLYSLNTTEQC